MQKYDLTEFDALKANLTVFVDKLPVVQISTPEQQIEVQNNFNLLKTKLKEIETIRVAKVRPFNDTVDSINDYAKEIKGIINAKVILIEKSLLAWNNILRERQRIETERIAREEAEKKAAAQKIIDDAKASAEFEASLGEVEQATETMLVAENQVHNAEVRIEKDTKRELKNVSLMKVKGVRTVKNFKVIDVTKVPKKYLVVDEVALRKDLVASGWTLEIKGVEIFETESLSSR